MISHSSSDRDQHAVHLTLDESLTNASRHRNGEKLVIWAILHLLVLTVHVWIEVAAPQLLEKLAPLPGRGLTLMRSFMSFVEYSNGVKLC